MAGPRTLIDGRRTDAVPADDRGLAYGDGVFRTVRVDDGVPWLWAGHRAALGRDAARLGIPFDDLTRAALDGELRELAGSDSGVLRVTLTRGSGPRGYRPPPRARARRILQFRPAPPPRLPAEPIAARLCRTTLSEQPVLAGVKHLNRLEQVMARAEWSDDTLAEGVMCDRSGRPVCGTMTNLFVLRDRELATPPVDRCGVAGVVRAELLERAGDVAGIRCVERPLALDELLTGDEVLVTNAVSGVRALRCLHAPDGRVLAQFPTGGPVGAALAAMLLTGGGG